MPDYTDVASLAADYMNRYGWSKDAVKSCSFEMDTKTAGPHCVGRAVNLAADELGLPFTPIHTFLAGKIRVKYPEYALAGDDVDVIAEWNNHPAVTREDVDALLAEVAG
jgi:hypothetical protein